MRTANGPLIALSDLPVELPWTSDAIHIGTILDYAVQVKYITVEAVISLQCSCDEGVPSGASYPSQNYKIENWTEITNSTTNLTEDGDITFDVDNASYKWVRVVISGTGFVTSARFNSKG